MRLSVCGDTPGSRYAFNGNLLQLKGTFPYQGDTIQFVITWTRVDPK